MRADHGGQAELTFFRFRCALQRVGSGRGNSRKKLHACVAQHDPGPCPVPSHCSTGTIPPSRPTRSPCRRAQGRSRMAVASTVPTRTGIPGHSLTGPSTSARWSGSGASRGSPNHGAHSVDQRPLQYNPRSRGEPSKSVSASPSKSAILLTRPSGFCGESQCIVASR
jgi:hypothetical protein